MGTLAWHFIAREGVLRDGSPTADVERYSGSLELCESGLHASVRPIDALRYAPGAIVRRVECSGDVIHGNDKLVCTERRVLWTRDATATLYEFALWCAEQAIDREERAGRKVDPRSREAIAVKRAWLRGDATDEQVAAARSDARDAARSVAWSVAWDAQNAELERRLLALEES